MTTMNILIFAITFIFMLSFSEDIDGNEPSPPNLGEDTGPEGSEPYPDIYKEIGLTDEIINGIPIKNGKLSEGTISNDHMSGSFKLHPGAEVSYPKEGGEPRVSFGAATFMKDKEYFGRIFKKGTVVSFVYSKPKYVNFPEDMKIGEVSVPKKAKVAFQHNGNLESVQFLEDYTIDGILYKPYGGTTFYADGKVKMGYLKKDQEIGGIIIKGSTYVNYHGNGKIREGISGAEQNIQGKKVMIGEKIILDESGKLIK